MARTPVTPRFSPWWLAAGAAVVVAVAWLAGASGSGLRDPASGGDPTGTVPPNAERIAEAEAFWIALGGADLPTVLAALEPGAGTPLSHYVAFVAGFEAGFEPETCRQETADTIRCTLRATNADLVDLYWTHSQTTEYVGSGWVTFGEEGIASFHEPGLISSATSRLLAAARTTDEGVPAACDRGRYDAVDLPPINTSIALTAECADALLILLPDVLAAEGE